jgi:hypothetical protein
MLAAVLAAGCNQPPKESAKAPAPKEAPKTPPPDDQPISFNVAYNGEEDGETSNFDFRAVWGDWKHEQQLLDMSSKEPQPAKFETVCGTTVFTPVFSGSKGQYRVKLSDPAGKLMGEFDVVDTAKQVKLAGKSTPGYKQSFISFDEERRVTVYQIQEKQGPKLGRKTGVLFIGTGWKQVDSAKKRELVGKYDFPKLDVMVLPPDWMADNDIENAIDSLKRGTATAAGVTDMAGK